MQVLLLSQLKIKFNSRQCKKSHGGPLVDVSEIQDVVNKYSDEDYKKLHSILNLEIRYRNVWIYNDKRERLVSSFSVEECFGWNQGEKLAAPDLCSNNGLQSNSNDGRPRVSY